MPSDECTSCFLKNEPFFKVYIRLWGGSLSDEGAFFFYMET